MKQARPLNRMCLIWTAPTSVESLAPTGLFRGPPRLSTFALGVMMKEQWRDVVGYEGFYQISSVGRIKRIAGGKGARVGRILRLSIRTNGYISISLTKHNERRTVWVHRLVCIAFLGLPPARHEVNHKNGVPSDNRIENLEWVTHDANMKHAHVVLGRAMTKAKGENQGHSKLTNDQVREMRQLHATGNYTCRLLSLRYGVCNSNINRIVNRKMWKHI